MNDKNTMTTTKMEVACCSHFLVVFCQQTTKKQSLVDEKLLFLHSNRFECKATLVHTRGCLLHSFFGCFVPTKNQKAISHQWEIAFLHSNQFECKATLVHSCLFHSFFGCFAPTNKQNLLLMRDCFFYVWIGLNVKQPRCTPEVDCCVHFLVVFCQQITKKQSLVDER